MKTRYSALLITIVALGCLPGARSWAQSQPPKAISIDIPSQSLGEALTELGRQTGLQVVLYASAGKRATTERLMGTFTPEAALARLLTNTGLKYEYLDEQTVAVLREGEGLSTDRAGVSATQGNGREPAVRVAQADAPVTQEQAQGAGDAHPGENPDDVMLEEIVVTAQKRVERLQDVPVPVTVISADDLVNRGQTRLQEVYSRIPGLNLTTNSIFGRDRRARHRLGRLQRAGGRHRRRRRALQLRDDHFPRLRLSRNRSEQPRADRAVARPSRHSVRASSIGGLLKYVTVEPALGATSGRLQAGITHVKNGDTTGYNVGGNVNVPLGETAAARLSGFTRRDAGYIDNLVDGREAVNRADTAGGRVAFLWRPTDNFSLKFATLLQDSDVDGTSQIGVGPGFADLQQNVLPGTDMRKEVQVHDLRATMRLGRVDLTAISSYSDTENRYRFDQTPLFLGLAQLAFPEADGAFSPQIVRGRRYTEELRATMPIGGRADWMLGGFYVHEEGRNRQDLIAADFASGEPIGEALNIFITAPFEEYAAFTNLTLRPTERFDLQLGARASRNEQSLTQTVSGAFGDSVTTAQSEDSSQTYLFTPRFRFSDWLMLYTRIASGYRPGGPNFNVALGAQPEFDPDTTWNYELGMKGAIFDRVLNYDLSVYHIDWKRIQLFVGNGVITWLSNGSRASSDGVELAVSAKPAAGLSISAWVAYNDARLTEDMPEGSTAIGEDGDRLPFSSRWSGSLSIDQAFNWGSDVVASVGASANYVGRRLGIFRQTALENVPRVDFPSYVKVDLRAGVQKGSWALDAYANNLTDRRALLSGDTFPTATFDIIQPRTIGLSISKTY